jgi:hypothetical protein
MPRHARHVAAPRPALSSPHAKPHHGRRRGEDEASESADHLRVVSGDALNDGRAARRAGRCRVLTWPG